MEKFLCVHCFRHYDPNSELFVRNQYCTGFCRYLHLQQLKAEAPKIERPKTAVKKKAYDDAA